MNKTKLKDHREIGRDLDLFSFHEYAPGAIFWHPKGWIIYQILIDFIRRKTASNYEEISTPILVKSDLFKQSGHWEHFRENIFSLKDENQDFSLKPMNCPEAALVYKTKIRSYNDLPLRFSEFGILHRKELSGVIGGLLRVRQFVIDDAHLFVRPDQIQEEIHKLLLLVIEVYQSLSFKPKFYLATRPDKAMGDKKSWQEAEKDLEKALKDARVNFNLKPKDGAFYGPKIDIHIDDSQGRDWQLATIQLDFQIPQRMNLSFINKDGEKEKPVMIHQGIFGSLERFIGVLTEHFQGAFPLWLSPIQIVILPISDKFKDYANQAKNNLISESIRVEVDERNETLQAKIRDATLQKIPYILIVGEKEKASGKIAVRTREGKDLGQIAVGEFKQKVLTQIENKS